MSALLLGGRCVLWMGVISTAAVLTAAVLVPRVTGATPYTVLTGSMTPSLPPGTLAVVRPVPVEDIEVGSVITYQLQSGEPAVVTHRVVEVRNDLTGETGWRTQGDANDLADPDWVRPEQVRGEVWYAVPKVGHVGTWLDAAQRNLAARLVGAALVLYAALMFAASLRSRGRRETVEVGS